MAEEEIKDCGRFRKGRQEKIEQDVTFLDFDFESLAHLLTSPPPLS